MRACDLLSTAGLGQGHARKDAEWVWLGRIPYAQANELQESVRAQVASGTSPNTLLLLEHEPVITLGRNADAAHIVASASELASLGIRVERSSRGGDVTYHGPGQLVGYPIFRLARGVRAHVCAIAESIVAVLARLGIEAQWREDRPGVWVGLSKICALGVHVRRGVAMHGFALNVDVDLDRFRTIVPCGLHGFGVTSIERETGSRFEMEELAARVADSFAVSSHVDMARIEPISSRLQIANWNR
jgi:lipoyl(octanoyl) transferase